MSQDPNSFDQEIKDANANPELKNDQGTEGKVTPKDLATGADQVVDYQVKFSESSKEAIRLLNENKAKDLEIERLRQLSEKGSQDESLGEITENLYPGFEELDEQAKENLIKFTNSVTKRAQDQILKDPAIAFSRQIFNEKKWDSAFENVVSKRPELKEKRDEFKAKYFKASNVPDNIENILDDVSKIFLFDNAKEIGARELEEKSKRMDLERTTGGNKEAPASRSLQDWQKMAQDNPVQFAKMSKEYHADLSAGKLKE
jgi:hypothetical protein